MYRNGAPTRRSARPPAPAPAPNNSPPHAHPANPGQQQQQPDTYAAAYYQQQPPQPQPPQQAPNGGAYGGPQSPLPYAKYAGGGGGGGYDGSGAWGQHYPASPTPPAPAPVNSNSYSPRPAPLTASAQPVNSFYNHTWDAQPQPSSPAPPYPPQPHRSNGGMMGHQAQAPAPAPGAGFYNPNAHPAAQQQQQQQYPYMQPQPTGSTQAGNFAPTLQNAVPLMMAGMQLAAGATGNAMPTNGMNAQNFAYLGQQMLHQVAPGAAQILADRDAVSTFMRLPKYYFQVNHAYVRRKLLLLLKPWGARTWVRQRAVQTDPSQPEYLPPRDDVNAPDLYIPLMAFATYVLLAGTVLASRNAFKPQVLAQYLSKGAGVLTLEAVVIKLGLYLINAKKAPWLDVIAYRGYKFVGVALTMAAALANKRLYWPMTVYSASAMGLFLMRSHRRIVLPRDAGNNPAELARRNAFLLFLCALQYPVYWVLVLS